MSKEQHSYHVGDEVMIIANVQLTKNKSVLVEFCDGSRKDFYAENVAPYSKAVTAADTALIEYVLRVRSGEENRNSVTMDELVNEVFDARMAADPAKRNLAIALKALNAIKSKIGTGRNTDISDIVEKALQDLK